MKIKKTYQSIVPNNIVQNTYDNSKNNVYSCDYINQLNNYSTEEHIVGKWVDGNNLYSKTIFWGSSQSSNYLDIDLISGTNVQILMWEAFCLHSTGIITNLLFDRNITGIYLSKDNGTFRLHYKPNSADLVGTNYITIYYMK